MNRLPLSRHIAQFGPCFDLFQVLGLKRTGVSDVGRLRERPLDALFLFTSYAHARAGAGPQFSTFHRVAICRALGSPRYQFSLNRNLSREIRRRTFSARVWKEFLDLVDNANEKLTRGPVRDVLVRLRVAPTPNLVSLLLSLGAEGAYEWLVRVRGIGPKIASLMVRDSFTFCRRPIATAFLWAAQPVDRWVRFWAEKCWPRERFVRKHKENAVKITSLCHQDLADPLDFNKGAWFVGAHFSALRILHGEPESLEADYGTGVRCFSAELTLKAMQRYRRELKGAAILPL